jgi:preprotein translocase subunit SecF
MEKFDFRKYKYLLATVFIFVIFIMLVANAYKYLPKQNETNNLKNKNFIETEEQYNAIETSDVNEEINKSEDVIKEESTIDENKTENKFANFFDEEEKNLDFETTERFKELSDDELE